MYGKPGRAPIQAIGCDPSRLNTTLYRSWEILFAVLRGTNTTSNVTLDLNGFAITGLASCAGTPGVMTCVFSGSGDGIVSPFLLSDVVVRNGTVRRMRVGILLEGGSIRVENVNVRRCSASGIVLNASAAVVSGSSVTLNRGEGIDTSLDSRVFRNTSTGNNGVGINVGQFSLVRENTVTANGGFGIAAPAGALVIGNTVADNNGVGLSLVDDPGFVNNVLSGNGEPQVNGGVQLGTNLCDGAPCP